MRSAQLNMMVSQRVGNTSRGNGVKKQHFGGQVPHPSRTEVIFLFLIEERPCAARPAFAQRTWILASPSRRSILPMRRSNSIGLMS